MVLPGLVGAAQHRGHRVRRWPTASAARRPVPPFVALDVRRTGPRCVAQLLDRLRAAPAALVRPRRPARCWPSTPPPTSTRPTAVRPGTRGWPGSGSPRRTPTGCGGSPSSATRRPLARAAPVRRPRPGTPHERRPSAPTSLVIGSGFGGAIPAYNLAAGGAKVVMLERGPELGAADFTQSLRIGGYTRIVDLINGRRHPGRRRQLRRRLQRRLLRRLAARAVVRLRAARDPRARRLWPPALTRAVARPLVRPGRGDASRSRSRTGTTCPTPAALFAAACDHAGHTCNPVPVAVDLRPLHQLQLDAQRLPLRRQAFDAAQLPAGRPGARRRGPRRCTRCSASRRRSRPGYRYRVDYTVVDADDYRVPVGAGVDRGQGRGPRGGHDGHPGDPAALGARAWAACRPRSAGTSRRTATGSRWRSSTSERVARRARPAPRTRARRTRRSRSASRSARCPTTTSTRSAAGVQQVRAAADLLPADHQHPARGRHPGCAAVVRGRQEGAVGAVAVVAHAARDDRGRQRRTFGARCHRPATSSGSPPPR